MITYDDRFMAKSTVGDHGNDEADLGAHYRLIQPVVEALYSGQLPEPGYGFTQLPDDVLGHTKILQLVDQLKKQFDTLLVLGIGGSDLGARAVSQALLHPFHNAQSASERPGMKLYFAGANTDPRELAMVLSQLDWTKTVINVISKSGETLETMAAFLVCQAELEKTVGKEQAKRQIIATTGKSGTLRQLAEQEGYVTLPVSETVGGRFSVLSPVGLFPLAAAGVETERLLAGAKAMVHRLEEGPTAHPAVRFALHHFLGNTTKQKSIAVLMPYAEALRAFGFWYRQLWAESLGKQKSVDGKDVFVGQTPIAALGATDQHSQIQLYIEGPFDKLITFVTTDHCRADQLIPTTFPNFEALAYIGGKNMSHLLSVEQKATAAALSAHGRPNGTIHMEIINESELGELIMMFELAAAFSGKLYNINPFDQPGVEHGKRNIEALLGRPNTGQTQENLTQFL